MPASFSLPSTVSTVVRGVFCSREKKLRLKTLPKSAFDYGQLYLNIGNTILGMRRKSCKLKKGELLMFTLRLLFNEVLRSRQKEEE